LNVGEGATAGTIQALSAASWGGESANITAGDCRRSQIKDAGQIAFGFTLTGLGVRGYGEKGFHEREGKGRASKENQEKHEKHEGEESTKEVCKS